jgi:tripartite-type tricarboxylate transporter receptor subunit TctC
LALLLTATFACAQPHYPNRPVELVVPFAAGGGTDLIARLMCDGLSRRLGAPFVAVNRAGANTNIGMQVVSRAKEDGYTLLLGSVGFIANPALYAHLSFDPGKELTPITLLATSSTVVVVHPSLPVDNVPELISYLRDRPGQINYASYGTGSGPHLAAELFQSATGTKLVQIPYRGGGQAAVAVLRNEVQMFFSGPLPVLAMIRDGRLKPIAVAAERRLAVLPDVPTFREYGIDYRSGTWFGLFAPRNLDAEILRAIHRAAVATLDDPAVREHLSAQGADIIASSPSEFERFIIEESKRLAVMVRAARLRLN